MKWLTLKWLNLSGFLTAFILFSIMVPAHADPALRWISSTPASPWQEMPVPEPTPSTPGSPASPLRLDPLTTFQRIDGFGGCFNDLGWQALLALNPTNSEAVLKELFASSGANFTLGRVPLGANDFSLCWYSLDETPGDYQMHDFSIARDRHELIPFIKAAMVWQPKLGIWGVPWSPPAWMKTNNHYKGGFMKQDARTLAAYALYFSKYIQAYRAEGLNLYAVMPQNEPVYNDNIYPQCKWSGPELNVFIRDYLVPRFQRDKLDVQVWFGTIVARNLAEFVEPVLDDPISNPSIVGVGYQYNGQAALLPTHQKYPNKKLSQTETECYNGENSWDQGLITFEKIIQDTAAFANSYFYWNLVLNESGRSSWNWRQNSLVTIDRRQETVTYNPEFYSLKHFSANVLPGAKRIAVSGGPFSNVVAFLNPSGEKVVIFANDSAQVTPCELETRHARVNLTVPARSMNTIVLHSD